MRSRSGSLQLLLVVLFLLFILLLAWVVNSGLLWAVQAELERLADAAALAATRELVNDTHLRGYLDPTQKPTGMVAVLENSDNVAIEIGKLNPVNGKQFLLNSNFPTNDPDGDIVFGFMDHPKADFVPATNIDDDNNTDLIGVNAVRIRALMLRSRGNPLKLFFPTITGVSEVDLGAQATAMLDRDVIGFRHPGAKPIPLAPLALLADYTPPVAKESWQEQIEDTSASGKDEFAFDGSKFVAGSDGLREFSATIALDSSTTSSANVALLFIGITKGDHGALNTQLATGVTRTELEAHDPVDRQLVLDPADNSVTVSGDQEGPADPSTALDDLVTNLNTLRTSAAIRIFPLYREVDGSGNPVVCGFVAARVVEVGTPNGNKLTFTLQPTMIASGAAVTNFAQRNANPDFSILNKYISKVRLVD
jgi:hypothetical protein